MSFSQVSEVDKGDWGNVFWSPGHRLRLRNVSHGSLLSCDITWEIQIRNQIFFYYRGAKKKAECFFHLLGIFVDFWLLVDFWHVSKIFDVWWNMYSQGVTKSELECLQEIWDWNWIPRSPKNNSSPPYRKLENRRKWIHICKCSYSLGKKDTHSYNISTMWMRSLWLSITCIKSPASPLNWISVY